CCSPATGGGRTCSALRTTTSRPCAGASGNSPWRGCSAPGSSAPSGGGTSCTASPPAWRSSWRPTRPPERLPEPLPESLETGPVLLGGGLLQGVLEARLGGRGRGVVERTLTLDIAGGPQHVVEALAGRPVDPDPDGREHLRLLVAQALVAIDLRQDRLGPPEERIVAVHALILSGAHNGGVDTTGQIDLQLPDGTVAIHSLRLVADEVGIDLAALPHTVKILLENLVR